MKTRLRQRIKESAALVAWCFALAVINVLDVEFVDRLVAEDKK